MKIGVYDIINDPMPKLYKIKDIDARKEEFHTVEGTVAVLNRELLMNKLSSEHMYAIAQDLCFNPKGILLCGMGDYAGVNFTNRTLATGLLLLGTERFSVFHNHPSESKHISFEDTKVRNHIENLSKIIGIDFDDFYMISKGFYVSCSSDVYNDYPDIHKSEISDSLAAIKKLKKIVENKEV